MLVTDLAMRDMEQEAISWFSWIRETADRIWRLSGTFRWSARTPQSCPEPPGCVPVPPKSMPIWTHSGNSNIGETTLPADSTDTRFRWRRHSQLRNRPIAGLEDMATASRQEALSSAARGILLARSERLDDAREAFALAARDRTIDLTAIPGFWDLSRAGMLVASTAYADAERFRDAAALAARVRTTYRPRAMRPVLTTTGQRRKALADGD